MTIAELGFRSSDLGVCSSSWTRTNNPSENNHSPHGYAPVRFDLRIPRSGSAPVRTSTTGFSDGFVTGELGLSGVAR
jgi:hypothetical protein